VLANFFAIPAAFFFWKEMKDKFYENKIYKETIKVRDLKPVKDAKGGWPPDPCAPKGVQSPKSSVLRFPNTMVTAFVDNTAGNSWLWSGRMRRRIHGQPPPARPMDDNVPPLKA
jgi:hypothetical protein